MVMDMKNQCNVCVDPSSESRFSGGTWIRAAGCLLMTPSFPLSPPSSHGYRWPFASPVARGSFRPGRGCHWKKMMPTCSHLSDKAATYQENSRLPHIAPRASRHVNGGAREGGGVQVVQHGHPVHAHAQRQEQHSASSDSGLIKKSVHLSNLQDEVKKQQSCKPLWILNGRRISLTLELK